MYLLRMKKKHDGTDNVSITLMNEDKEFVTITELVNFFWKNAMFIESYKIFELKELDKEGILTIGSNSCGGSIRMEA